MWTPNEYRFLRRASYTFEPVFFYYPPLSEQWTTSVSRGPKLPDRYEVDPGRTRFYCRGGAALEKDS